MLITKEVGMKVLFVFIVGFAFLYMTFLFLGMLCEEIYNLPYRTWGLGIRSWWRKFIHSLDHCTKYRCTVRWALKGKHGYIRFMDSGAWHMINDIAECNFKNCELYPNRESARHALMVINKDLRFTDKYKVQKVIIIKMGE